MSKHDDKASEVKPALYEYQKPDLLAPGLRLMQFQQIFLIFFVFSIFGHYLEVVWSWVGYLTVGSKWYPRVADLIPLAVPYGLGAVALIMFVWPIMKKYNLHIVKVFILSAIVTASVEFMCALFLVILYGKNYFWDYSSKPLNLFGFTWVGAAFLFGIVSVVFLYVIYPYCEYLLNKLSKRQLAIAFWPVFSLYIINLILVFIREFL